MAEKITNPAIEKAKKKLDQLTTAINNKQLSKERVDKEVIEANTNLVGIQKEIETSKKALTSSKNALKKQEELTVDSKKKAREASDILLKVVDELNDTNNGVKTAKALLEIEKEGYEEWKQGIEKEKLKMLIAYQKTSEKIEHLMQ